MARESHSSPTGGSRRHRPTTGSNARYDAYLQKWRNSRLNPARSIVVIVVAIVLAISLATPLRTYYQQRTEKEALQAENAQLVEDIKRKEEQLAVQNDPKMIEEQARQRLLLIPRGETGFRVILPGKEQDENVQQHVDDVPNLSLNGGGPWYRDLWRSISVPDPNIKTTQ